jgi:hypothetical protein
MKMSQRDMIRYPAGPDSEKGFASEDHQQFTRDLPKDHTAHGCNWCIVVPLQTTVQLPAKPQGASSVFCSYRTVH